MKLPISRNPIQSSTLNINYETLQKFTFEELKEWILALRNELYTIWRDRDIPPSIGKDKNQIIKQFSKLKLYEVDKLFFTDKYYPNHLGFIKNFTKLASPINQFFPSMLKTKINGKSMWDWFENDNLKRDFIREIVRAVRFDKMYSYSEYLKDDFVKWYDENNHEEIGYWLEPQKIISTDLSTYLSLSEIKLLKDFKLKDEDFRNDVKIDGDEPTIGYKVRVYEKHQKVFPNIIQVFRLGLGQPPVNFPPLTAKLIYDKYLPTQEHHIIWDMCSGWGGRLLGSLCSDRQIHYIGSEVNLNNKGCYEELGEFYNSNCGGDNTFEIFYQGAEIIHQNKSFQKYKGKVSLCFTSPPYFGREQYSQDKEQSFIKFPNYNDWLNGFMKPMIKNSWDYLKPNGHLILNIADIKMGSEYIPLEQHSIELALQEGFNYLGNTPMVMSRSIGIKTDDAKNNWFDSNTNETYKTEPILIFKKD